MPIVPEQCHDAAVTQVSYRIKVLFDFAVVLLIAYEIDVGDGSVYGFV
jgi:hypothetical protein